MGGGEAVKAARGASNTINQGGFMSAPNAASAISVAANAKPELAEWEQQIAEIVKDFSEDQKVKVRAQYREFKAGRQILRDFIQQRGEAEDGYFVALLHKNEVAFVEQIQAGKF